MSPVHAFSRRTLRALVVPLFPLLAAMAVVAACDAANQSPKPSGPAIGGVWTAVRVADVATVPNAEPQLNFENDGRVIDGITGCSAFRAEVGIDADRIVVGQIVPSDRQDCGPEPAEVERGFLALLASAQRLESARGRLTVISPDGDILLVTGELELTPAELEVRRTIQSTWRVTGLEGAPAPDAYPPLEFREDGTLLAAGACGLGGRWALRGEDIIRITHLGWDAVGGCPPGLDRLRADLASRLELVRRVRVTGDGSRMELLGRADAVLVEARPD
jgi:heat shock protein HslJ